MIVHGCLNVKKKKKEIASIVRLINIMYCKLLLKNKDFYLKKYIYQSSISNRKTLCADFICRLHSWKETIRIQVHFHLQWQSMLTEQQVDYNWSTLFVKFKEIIFDKLKVRQIFVNKNKEGNTIILFLLPVLYYHFCSIHFPLAVFFLGKWIKVRLY